MWSRTLRGLVVGAILPVVLGCLLGCGEDSGLPLPSMDSELEASEFVWSDGSIRSSKPESDLEKCRQRVGGDPWVLAQGDLNQGIILVGCMQKKGWRWRSGDLSGGAPSVERRAFN